MTNYTVLPQSPAGEPADAHGQQNQPVFQGLTCMGRRYSQVLGPWGEDRKFRQIQKTDTPQHKLLAGIAGCESELKIKILDWA